MWYGIIRKGGVTHFGPGDSMDAADLALCGKVVPIGGRSASSHSKLKPTCKACAKSWESQRATRGDNQNADKGNNVTATQATATTDRDKAVEEINDAIDRLPAVTKEGGDVEALKGEIETSISALKGKGVAAIKAELRAKAREVADAALVAAAAGTEVEVRGTVDYTTIPAVVENRKEAAKLIREGVLQQTKLSTLARRIAETEYEARIRLTDKNGKVDWDGKSAPAKQYTTDTLTEAGEGYEDTPENRDAVKKLWTAIVNQRRNVAVFKTRGYDETMTDEEREIFKDALAAYPDLKPSEAIQKFHNMPTNTKSEALAAKNKAVNELEGGSDSEGSGEGESGGDSSGASDSTPAFSRAVSHIEKSNENFAKVQKDREKMTDEERAAIKAELDKTIAKLAGLANLYGG